MSQIFKQLTDTEEESARPKILSLVSGANELPMDPNPVVKRGALSALLLGLITLTVAGTAIFQVKKYRRPEQTAQKALLANREFVFSQNKKAVENFYSGNIEEASKNLAQAIEKDPLDVSLRVNQGILLRHSKKMPEAVAALNLALDIQPENAAALNEMGRVLLDEGRLKEAEDLLKKASSIATAPAEVYLNMGELAEREEKWTLAAQDYGLYLQSPQADPALKKMILRRNQTINSFLIANRKVED